MNKYRQPQHLLLTSTLDRYMLDRCKSRERPASESELSPPSNTSLQLRARLLTLRSHLASTLTLLTDYQLSQLVSAITIDNQTLTAQREQYLAFSRQLRGDNAAIHGEGIAKRSTPTGKATNKKVAQRVKREVDTREQLKLGEKLLEQAIRGLKV